MLMPLAPGVSRARVLVEMAHWSLCSCRHDDGSAADDAHAGHALPHGHEHARGQHPCRQPSALHWHQGMPCSLISLRGPSGVHNREGHCMCLETHLSDHKDVYGDSTKTLLCGKLFAPKCHSAYLVLEVGLGEDASKSRECE